jgi:hypothetical protein
MGLVIVSRYAYIGRWLEEEMLTNSFPKACAPSNSQHMEMSQSASMGLRLTEADCCMSKVRMLG